ncbi:MAG: hypothetical protein HY038_09030 [Nitrospirae bacterium]|nr:hypothetical protein [Nitrospirota bacterium]
MHTRWDTITVRLLGPSLLTLMLLAVHAAATGQFGTPKGDEGMRIFKATEHPYYSGQFHLSGQKAILIGSVNDRTPWDHLDYAGKHLTPVQGTIDIEVNELTNSGQVVAEFIEGSDRYRIVFDRFAAKAPFQDGGVATRIYEHGDSNNGDPLYPKTWLYLGGLGTARMFKNQEVLYKDYDAHFMVMERSRDPMTHEVRYPVKRTLPGGETDPAGMEIDLWVRSKEQNTNNFPPFETFVHLCWEEVTWR